MNCVVSYSYSFVPSQCDRYYLWRPQASSADNRLWKLSPKRTLSSCRLGHWREAQDQAMRRAPLHLPWLHHVIIISLTIVSLHVDNTASIDKKLQFVIFKFYLWSCFFFLFLLGTRTWSTTSFCSSREPFMSVTSMRYMHVSLSFSLTCGPVSF